MQDDDRPRSVEEGCSKVHPVNVGPSAEHPAAVSLAWENVHDLIVGLARRAAADGVPDVVVAIQRGGLVPGVMLSHLLQVRSLVVFNIRRTIHDGVAAPKTKISLFRASIAFRALHTT